MMRPAMYDRHPKNHASHDFNATGHREEIMTGTLSGVTGLSHARARIMRGRIPVREGRCRWHLTADRRCCRLMALGGQSAAAPVERDGSTEVKTARWVSEAEARWAADLFADYGTAIIGSEYGRPCKRVRLSGISQFQAERLVSRFGGQAFSESWRCSGPAATFFLRSISPFTSVEFTKKSDLPLSNMPTCRRSTKTGSECQRIARTDLGYTTCWTHRADNRGE